MSADGVRIGAQLHRLFNLGYLRHRNINGGPWLEEYTRALSSLPPDLLETAISRWIETSREKWFPFPGELRALVQDDLDRRASELLQLTREPFRIPGHFEGCACPTCSEYHYQFGRNPQLKVIEGGR